MMDLIYSYCIKIVFKQARKLQILQYLADTPWLKYVERLEKS
jgi:hypothetical protein